MSTFRSLENIFVLLHIRISGFTFVSIEIRNLITSILLFTVALLVFLISKEPSLWELFKIFIVAFGVGFILLFWIIAWPKADLMLKKAKDSENEAETRGRLEELAFRRLLQQPKFRN